MTTKTAQSKTIKTRIHRYSHTAHTPEYKALREKLSADHGRGDLHEAIGAGLHIPTSLDGATIELETDFLFGNQWNTAPIPGVSDEGLRVFDWCENAVFNDRGQRTQSRNGWYLDITDEMRAIRRQTLQCGYCGHYQKHDCGLMFCPDCLGSEYLEAKDLHLLRLLPVDEPFGADRAELTDAERAEMLPRFVAAQTFGNTERDKARIAKLRAKISKKCADTIRNAEIERDGFTYLMDHGIKTGNVIFYDHTGRFCFGWRKKLSAEELSALLDVITEFSWPYDIECADGRKLSGE